MTISYREITPDDAAMMIKWRTAEHINSRMLTDIKHIALEDQIKWIKSLYQNPFGYGWIISVDNHDIGYANINLIGDNHDSTNNGFYIYDLKYRIFAMMVIHNLCTLCCSIQRIKNICLIIKDDNINMIKMCLNVGYQPAMEEEKRRYPHEISPGFNMYVFHGNPDLHKTARFPVKSWQGRDPSILSNFFIY